MWKLVRLKEATLSFHFLCPEMDLGLCEDFIDLLRRSKDLLMTTGVKGLVRTLFSPTTILGSLTGQESIAITIQKPFPLQYFNIIISTDSLYELVMQSESMLQSYSKWLLVFLHELAHLKGAETEDEADKMVYGWFKVWKASN